MKLSDDYVPGVALATFALNERLLSLLLTKGVLNRHEVFELLETTLLSLEQLQSHFSAALKWQSFEGYLKAARFQIELMRLALNTRHPPNSESNRN
jgi:hypothetical protein